MPSNAFTSAGTTIAINSSEPAAFTGSGFGALSFLDIGEVTNIPEFGKVYNLVTHNPIGDRKTYKRKGSYNQGSVTLQMARVPSDAGQAALITARDSDDPVSFEVTLNDSAGTIIYFTALVMGYTTNVGEVDSITGASVTIEIDSDPVEV